IPSRSPTKPNHDSDTTCWGVRKSSGETSGQMFQNHKRGRRHMISTENLKALG
ncbi:hypothetical protein A2U01_0018723, partial [Trifolium medium]|nr:hypothetical protein [Trifolium medium]